MVGHARERLGALGDSLAKRAVEVDKAVAGERQNERCAQLLVDRAELEARLGRVRLPGLSVGEPQPAAVENLSLADDKRSAGEVARFQNCRNVLAYIPYDNWRGCWPRSPCHGCLWGWRN